MTSVKIKGLFTKNQAQGIKNALEGLTHLEFRVLLGSNKGVYTVTVITMDEDTTEKQLLEYVTYVAFIELAKHNQVARKG